MPFLRLVISPLATVALATLLSCAAARLTAQPSPFLPPADATTPSKTAANAGYAFVGMTELGADTLLSFTRLSDKVSVWIPLGKTINEITVVSYDAKTDTAVIKANGETLTLTMRKGTVVAAPAAALTPPSSAVAANGAPAPAPAVEPPIVVPNKPLTVQEEKELEARMLVTDLLEIGLRQRQAYAEAQRQAALKAANAKMPQAPAAEPTKH